MRTDGEKVYLTSSTLFSRKLEHLAGNPRVSLSITDPIAVGGLPGRATIQGGFTNVSWKRRVKSCK